MKGLTIAIDIILVLVIVIFTIISVKRGFMKTILGFVSSILVIVIAVFASAPLANAIGKGTELDEKIEAALSEKYEAKLPNAYNEILYYDLDNDGEKDLAVKDIEKNEYKPYSETFDGSAFKLIKLERLMQKTVERSIDKDDGSSITVVSAFSKTLTVWILIMVCFVSLLVISKIGFMVIIKLLENLIEKVSFVDTVDKVLGGIVGFIAGTLLILVVLALLQLMTDNLSFMNEVKQTLESTSIANFVMQNNFIYKLFESGFAFDKMKDLFGGFVKT
ncbi:MAG: CvpA family protein [Christensenellales bacterium]|jgi:uncharacterized membrane protein required for colicin V production|nr:CvpA family protein [Clostridiales bacterium]